MVLNQVWAQSSSTNAGMVDKDIIFERVIKDDEQGNAFYHDSGTLSIPSVDALGQPGLYRKFFLQYDSDIDAYKLMRVDAVPLTEDIVKQIDLVVTDEKPIQVFLKASVYFSYSCGNALIVDQTVGKYLDRPQYRLHFEVTVAFYNFLNLEAPCVTDDKLCAFILPLKVYGLSTGVYEYVVNGTHTETFELKSQNVVSDVLLKSRSKN